MTDFQLSLFKGNIFKELAKALFEKSQYLAIPYGYENPYSNVKKKLTKGLGRVRYETPQIKRIELYKKYWNDAIILFVVPKWNVFYAQEIDKLGIKSYYDLKSDFKKVQEIFPKIQTADLAEYQSLAYQLIEAMKTHNIDVKEKTRF